jgi:protocatechuate 3,4-dioxygenase beta subunit
VANRRAFLLLALATVACASPAGSSGGAGGSSGPCATAAARISIAGDLEPGPRLLVRGRLVGPGGAPAAGVVVYAYHTDRTGRYAADPGAPPRLRGWMRTDGEGRFEYRTIRPAGYPGSAAHEHVHHQAWGGGFPPQYLPDLEFADDPRRAGASDSPRATVCSPRHDGDVAVCTVEFRFDARGHALEPDTAHGFEACR